ncbi:MAG: NAD(+) diphosphatase [Treponema sp.]
MSFISNQNNYFCENHFVFQENSILLENIIDGSILTIDNLPTEETVRKFLSNQFASDWFAEPEYNYSAMMLDPDCPIPQGCAFISLRQFFWDTKINEEKENGVPSDLGTLASRAHGLLCWRKKMRFCPTCGAVLRDDPTFTAKKCVNCGQQFFPRIEPAIIVLVSKGDEILLARHVQRNTDVYSCIAGFVEMGETLEQCVAREVKEETSLNVKNIKYVGSQSWPFPDQLMLAFTAEYDSGEIAVQEEEISEAKWFKKGSLPSTPKEGSVAYNLIHNQFGK